MIYDYVLDGVQVKTGDLIFTTDGGERLVSGQFWWLIGKLIPGDVDHVVIYLGPEGRCIEAGPHGVKTFEAKNNKWEADAMLGDRGILDKVFGIGYPKDFQGMDASQQSDIREQVAQYCLAQEGKKYNINFLNSDTEHSFYCSHLAYKAYMKHGINLNTNTGIPDIPFTDSIIFPQEVQKGCTMR